jgi:hypothetical protein
MAQFIDKDALVAEINKRIIDAPINNIGHNRVWAYNDVKDIIDTLEVKEVDNVWHDANETPKGAGDKEILVQFSDFHTSVLEIDDWEYLDHQTKWAYLKDLI